MRTTSPLLNASQWSQLLVNTGFSNVHCEGQHAETNYVIGAIKSVRESQNWVIVCQDDESIHF